MCSERALFAADFGDLTGVKFPRALVGRPTVEPEGLTAPRPHVVDLLFVVDGQEGVGPTTNRRRPM